MAAVSELLTVRARIRRRTAGGGPVSTDVRWDEASAADYEQARDAIRARLAEDEAVVYWLVDR